MHYVAEINIKRVEDKPRTGVIAQKPVERQITDVARVVIKGRSLSALMIQTKGHLDLLQDETDLTDD